MIIINVNGEEISITPSGRVAFSFMENTFNPNRMQYAGTFKERYTEEQFLDG